MSDLWTVMTKEWREYFAPGGSRRGGVVSMLIFFGIFGVLLPLQLGRSFVDSFLALFYYAITVPLSMVMGVIADAFAGERERHTLETLLASRLSDRSILLGKLGAAVGYSWGMSLLTALLAVVVANLKVGGAFQFYPTGTWVSILIVSLLVAVLYASLGVVLSLRAATVRQVQQALSVSFIVILLGPFLIFQALSLQTRQQFAAWALTHPALAADSVVATGRPPGGSRTRRRPRRSPAMPRGRASARSSTPGTTSHARCPFAGASPARPAALTTRRPFR
jgi:ABC-2 type transport system permease protein